METISPAYLTALAAQVASLSAFLGGFAATYLATLLTLGHRGRVMAATIACAVAAAVSFVVTVVAATMLTAISHPDAPAALARSAATLPRSLMASGFMLGTMALLASLGLSGWTRSRGTGWTTTVAAAIGAVLILAMTVQVG